MAEKQTFTVIVATYDDKQNSATILAEPTGEGTPGVINVRFDKFDEAKRTYVKDDEAKQAAEERLASMNLTLDAIESGSAIGVEFEGYGQDGKIYMNPPRQDFKLKPVTFQDVNSIDKSIATTVQIFDAHKTHKFMIFVNPEVSVGKGADAKFERRTFKISQLRYVDPETGPVDISTKYTNKEIAQFEEQLNDENVNPVVREKIKDFVDAAVERARKAKVEEIKNAFGFDIDKLIESGEQLELKITSKEISGQNGGITYYLAGEFLAVVDAPEEEED